MNAVEYDTFLAGLHTSEEWNSIPTGDQILFWTFGTVMPCILRRQHRLIVAERGHFARLLSFLGTKAAEIAMPPSHQAASDYYSLEICSEAWMSSENQELLAKLVNEKPEAPTRNLLFDALLPKAAISRLAESPVCSRYGDGRYSDVQWFNALDELVDECGWFFITLSQLSQYNLWIFSEERAKTIIPLIDAAFETLEVKWAERVHWPEEV